MHTLRYTQTNIQILQYQTHGTKVFMMNVLEILSLGWSVEDEDEVVVGVEVAEGFV